MRVLVSGSTGYLGRHVLELLLVHECQVVALGHGSAASPYPSGVEYHALDLTRPLELVELVASKPKFDAIVHLAGPAPKLDSGWGPEGTELVSTHVRLALALRQAFQGWSGRLVHASGMPVYGIPRELPLLETSAREPCHMYGLAKLLSEEVLLSWRGVDRWILRLPGLFSAERKSGALYHFMRAASQGEPIQISASKPTPWDVLHVADAAEAIWRALDSSSVDPGALNVSYGERVDLESVAHFIADLAGHASVVQNLTGALHPVFQLDIRRVQSMFEWPPATLHERLTALYHDYGFRIS